MIVMSDIYISLAESFEKWFFSDKRTIDEKADVVDCVLAWADNTETDLGDYDLDILCDTIVNMGIL